MRLRERVTRALRGALCVLALSSAGCDSDTPPGAVSTGDAGPDARDDGGTDPGPPNPRPDGGPLLPDTDDERELPFGGEEIVYRIEAEADLGVLDLQLSIDTTASIHSEIDRLQRDLTRVILPGVRERVPDVSVGVARFEDFPLPPFGTEGDPPHILADRPFELIVPITSDEDRIEHAVAELDMPLGVGGDISESGYEALYQIATGDGFELDGSDVIAPYERMAEEGGGTLGGVGFREGALHVVLHVTDASSQTPETYGAKVPGAHSEEDAERALRLLDTRVVSVVSGFCESSSEECTLNDNDAHKARGQLERLALETRAHVAPDEDGMCPHGIDGEQLDATDGRCPLVFSVSSEGDGLSETVVDALAGLVDGIRFEHVTGIASDDPLGFVTRITPIEARDAPEIEDLLPEGAPDGVPDTFVGARAAAKLVFEIGLRNTRIAPRAVDQSFRVVLRIVGDNLIIEERTLRLVVPAGEAPPEPSEDDAG